MNAECAGVSATLPSSAERNVQAPYSGLPKHIPALDGLRGVAILLVLLVHFYQRGLFAGHPAASILLGRIAGAGSYGVELFFVLSGFLITGILIDNKTSPGSLTRFYARRCLRIFPLYYLTLAILLMGLPLFVPMDHGAHAIVAKQFWLWTYLSNWPSLDWIWDDSRIFLIGHFWSLCVEEHFYLFWPFVVYLVNRRALAHICMALILASLTSRIIFALGGAQIPILLQWVTIHKLDGLAIGALLAVIFRDAKLQEWLPEGKAFKGAIAIFGLLVLGIIFWPRRLHSSIMDAASGTVIVIFFSLLMIVALRSNAGDISQRVLSIRWLTAFGKYSYGIYVIHGVLRPQFEGFMPFDRLPSFVGSSFLYQFLYYSVAIAVSFLLAFGSFHLFEKQFLALKRYVSY